MKLNDFQVEFNNPIEYLSLPKQNMTIYKMKYAWQRYLPNFILCLFANHTIIKNCKLKSVSFGDTFGSEDPHKISVSFYCDTIK